MKTRLSCVFACLLTAQVGLAQAHGNSSNGNKVNSAKFLKNTEVVLPTDYRQWVHVGTFMQESGINVFDKSEVVVPIIGNTYIEPSAYKVYEKTGKWPDGTQIVKEFSQILDNGNCNKISHVCDTKLGQGIFQEKYTGFGYMVKDKKLFPNEAGNWAFFTTGNVQPPYARTAMKKPNGECLACHIKHASGQGYVFASQKLGLQKIKQN